jgi:hypothetical protein
MIKAISDKYVVFEKDITVVKSLLENLHFSHSSINIEQSVLTY